MPKSYFAILGITSAASAEEIRSAYRRLAKAYHPDHFEGGSGPFREIQEAYSVLGDARKCRQYRQSMGTQHPMRPLRRKFQAPVEPLVPEAEPVHLGNISPVRSFRTFSPSFDEIFDWLQNNLRAQTVPKSGRVQELTLKVELTREQARRGGSARVMVPARVACHACGGYGHIGFYECARCAGEGHISGEIPISVTFPAGVRSDHAVIVPLDRLGIRNLHLTVLFRPGDID
jgi:molecular chaperone DnaJ